MNEFENPRGFKVIQVDGYIMVIKTTRDGRKLVKHKMAVLVKWTLKTIESMI